MVNKFGFEVDFGGVVKGRALLQARGTENFALSAADVRNIINSPQHRAEVIPVLINLYDAVSGGTSIASVRHGISYW